MFGDISRGHYRHHQGDISQAEGALSSGLFVVADVLTLHRLQPHSDPFF